MAATRRNSTRSAPASKTQKSRSAAKRTTRVRRGGAVMARPKVEDNKRTGLRTIRKRRVELVSEFLALGSLALAALLLLALLSYHPADMLAGQWGDEATIRNWIGPFGAWTSQLAVDVMGMTAFALPLLLVLGAVSLFASRSRRPRWSELLGFFAVLASLALLVHLTFPTVAFRGADVEGGGLVGDALASLLRGWVGTPGAWIAGLTVLAAAARLAFGVRLVDLLRGSAARSTAVAAGVAGTAGRGVSAAFAGVGRFASEFRASLADGFDDWRTERDLRREEQRWEREERLAEAQARVEELAEQERAQEDHWPAESVAVEAPRELAPSPIAELGRTLVPEDVVPARVELELTGEVAPAAGSSRSPSRVRSRATESPGPAASDAAPTPVDPALRQKALDRLNKLTGVLPAPAEGPGRDSSERVDSMMGATSRGVVHAELRVAGGGPAQLTPAATGSTRAPQPSVREPKSGASRDTAAEPSAPQPAGEPASERSPDSRPRIKHIAQREEGLERGDRVVSARRMLREKSQPFELPALSLLTAPPEGAVQVDEVELQEQATRLEATLLTYGVNGRVTDILPGPVVTMFEFEPAPGVKVSKIAGLGDDLAMALRALKVRIVAPIPGKGAVGIEIPSKHRETVYFREILASKAFAKLKHKPLPLALGKGVDASPVVANMSGFPHVLVAGTTGSGKSVCVNSIIMSLLYTRTPDEVRLILVDPKMLEFSIYDGIPHLLVPVVTSPKKAALALNWAVMEMTRRYKVLAAMGTRNIVNYNEKAEQLNLEWAAWDASCKAGKPTEKPDCGRALGEDTVVFRSQGEEPVGPPEKMPFIVIIIDELADLMMVARKEVEESIVRLAQMARACGIHMLLATQRPSVDVITGLIKANFPTRLSFRVSSKVDSRTVLDANGAESLLGMGDGLLLPPGQSDVIRVHGAFVDDDEVQRVVDHLKRQGEPNYIEHILQAPLEDGEEVEDEPMDSMYDQCVEVVAEAGKASTSLLQRRLKLGYNRAARIMDMMERQGVIGPQDGARPREVYARPFDG